MPLKAPTLYKTYKFSINQIHNLKINIVKEELDRYLVQEFDNQLFRIIRNITGNIDKQIDEIIFVDTHGKKEDLESILYNGIAFNKRMYDYYGKNASMSRNGIIALIDRNIIVEVDKYAMMDIKLNKVTLSKFEAQKHLLMSSCHFIENWIPNIVIIKDFEKIIPNQFIRYVADVEKEYTDKETKEKEKYFEKTIAEGYKDIKVCPADGSGIHSPAVTKCVSDRIGIPFYPCLFQVRMPFLKGLSVEVDFHKWFAENHITEIVDYWGNVHSVDYIDAIWTDNMFKGVKYFADWGEYLLKFHKYDHVFGISKWNYSEKEEPKYIKTNYQCLQTLDIDKDKFLQVADYSKQWVERILSGDLLYVLKFLGKDDSSCKYITAIRKNPSMIKDYAVQVYIRGLLNGFIKEMKLGKVLIPGSYKFLIPDLQGFMEHAGGQKVVGCLQTGEFYSKGLYGEYLIHRNPHLSRSEQVLLNAAENDFTTNYCGYLDNICMLNYHDITDKRLNGSDKDGDGVIVTNDPLLISGVHKNLPVVIDIDDKVTALEMEYTKDNIIKHTLMSLTSEVGEISNCATGYHNKVTQNDKWKKIYDKNVSLLSIINGKEIDYAKTGVKWNIPYRIAKHSKPLPYFLTYKYPNMKKFNTAPSNMNCLAWNIEKWQKTLYQIKSEDTYGLLYNEHIPFDKITFDKILNLYEKFRQEYSALKKQEKDMRNKDDPNYENMISDYTASEIANTRIDFSAFYDTFKKAALEICPNEQELANYAVKIVYKIYPARDKTFAWTVAENGLLQNLKTDNKIIKIVPTNRREGVEYLGKWYRLEVL
jgi:hypothetical protein